MIYLLYGNDADKARAKLHELVGGLLKKKPDAAHRSINDETFSEGEIEELVSSLGLFSSKSIVEFNNVFRNKEAKEILLKRLADIAKSENVFVFLEGALLKKELAAFEKHAEKVQEFSVGEKAPAGKAFNVFSLTDAFGRRDKKQLWVLFTKAKMKDVADEEIHGILFWQLKAIIQSLSAKNAKDAGLNPFVYQKSSGFARNFSEEELLNSSMKLVALYHDARRGIVDFTGGLEQFILEM
jgi:DNA polymerase III delta subunit